jgi:hypothetical protein
MSCSRCLRICWRHAFFSSALGLPPAALRWTWHPLQLRCGRLFGTGVAVSGRQILLQGRAEPALLRLDECASREAEPQAIAKAPYRGVLAELAHEDSVRQLDAEAEPVMADLQQIDRLSRSRASEY